MTRANALLAVGQVDEALSSFEEAAGIVRDAGPRALLREVLGQWADVLAKHGQHEQAYALTREALAAS